MAQSILNESGRCIYCGVARYDGSGAALATEHVIPFSLNGNLLLANASCRQCERKINQFESACARTIFGPIRYHLGMRSRNPRSRPDTLPVTLKFQGLPDLTQAIPVSEFPVFTALLRSNYPAIIGVDRPLANQEIDIWLPNGADQLNEMLEVTRRRYNATSIALCYHLRVDYYNRLLAKIAHGFASAFCIPNTLQPLLVKLILQGYAAQQERETSQLLIGMDWRTPNNTHGNLHSLEFVPARIGNATLLFVRVGLFDLSSGSDSARMVGVGWLRSPADVPTAT